MITIDPGTFFRVQDNSGYRGHPKWHAAGVGPGVLCDVLRTNRAKAHRWRDGTDKVNCDACLSVMRAQSNVRHSVYELVGA